MVRLSLMLGVPMSRLGRTLTAADWMQYQIADRLGIIPDTYTEPQEPPDLMTGYRKRKAMYGG